MYTNRDHDCEQRLVVVHLDLALSHPLAVRTPAPSASAELTNSILLEPLVERASVRDSVSVSCFDGATQEGRGGAIGYPVPVQLPQVIVLANAPVPPELLSLRERDTSSLCI